LLLMARMSRSHQRAGRAEASRANRRDQVEVRSLVTFFALLSGFIATLVLRAHMLAAPVQQPALAAAAAGVHPVALTTANPASHF
jgi:hypothetical protein